MDMPCKTLLILKVLLVVSLGKECSTMPHIAEQECRVWGLTRTAVQGRIGEVSTASVATGVLGVGGNKGAVAVSFTLCRRRIACVCSHFAAHQVMLYLAIHS